MTVDKNLASHPKQDDDEDDVAGHGWRAGVADDTEQQGAPSISGALSADPRLPSASDDEVDG